MCSQAAGHRDAQPAVHAVALRRTPVTLDMRPTVSAKRRRWPAMITRRPVARALPHDRFAALADAGLVQARAGRRLVGPRGTRREDRGVAGPQRKAVAVGFVERLGDGRVLDIGDAAYAAQW